MQSRLCASPAEVKLLRAAASWLLRKQQHLTQWQLAGVIMSFGELLPRVVLRQMQSRAGDSSDQMQPPLLSAAAEGQLQETAQHKDSSAIGFSSQQREEQLVRALQELMEGWAPLVEDGQLAAVLAKRQANLLSVAWQRLNFITGNGIPSARDAEGEKGSDSY
jgi:hypothetical protein